MSATDKENAKARGGGVLWSAAEVDNCAIVIWDGGGAMAGVAAWSCEDADGRVEAWRGLSGTSVVGLMDNGKDGGRHHLCRGDHLFP